MKTPPNKAGMATLVVLVLLAFLAIMVATVLRVNVIQRHYLQSRRDSTQALYLAESGVEAALHTLAAGGGPGRLQHEDDNGRLDVEWRAAPGSPRTFLITASAVTGYTRVNLRHSTVEVRVERMPASADVPAVLRTTSWRCR